MIVQQQKEHTIDEKNKELYIEILRANKEIGLRFQDYISTHLSKISQISNDVLKEDKFNQFSSLIEKSLKEIRNIGDSVVEKCKGYAKQSNRITFLTKFSDLYLNYFHYKKEEIKRSIEEINNLIRKNKVRQKKKIYSADDVRAKFTELKFSNDKSYNPKLFSLYLDIDKRRQFLINDMNSKRQILFNSKRIHKEFTSIAERNMKYFSTLQQLSKYSSNEYVTKKNNIYKEIFISFMKLFESMYISLEQKYQNEYNKFIDKNKKKTVTINTQKQIRYPKKDISIYTTIDNYLQYIKPSKTFTSNQECIDIEDIFDDRKLSDSKNDGEDISILTKEYESALTKIEKLTENIKLYEKERKDTELSRSKVKSIMKELYEQTTQNEDDFKALVEELPLNFILNSSYSQETKTSETSTLTAFTLFNGQLDEYKQYISDTPQISFQPEKKEKALTKSLYSNSPVKFDQIPKVNEIIDNQILKHENGSKKKLSYPNRPIIQKYDEVQLQEGDIIVRNNNNSNEYLLPPKEIIDKVNAANKKKDKNDNSTTVELINPFKNIIISQSPKKEESVQSEGTTTPNEVKEPKKENNNSGFIFTDINNPFKVSSTEKNKKFDHPPLGDIGKKFFEEIAQQNDQGQKIQLVNESAPNEKLLPQDTLQFSDHKENTLEETKNIKPTDSILLPPVSKDSVYVYK